MTEDVLSDAFLATRRQELHSRANEKEIDSQWIFEKLLPEDNDTLIVLALASLLGFSSQEALDPNKTLDELEQDKEMREREEERSERIRFDRASRNLLGL
jgi:predicted nuclease of restriction endonuclease-like (RecB) superfamily